MNDRTKDSIVQITITLVMGAVVLLHELGIFFVSEGSPPWLEKLFYVLVGFGLGTQFMLAIIRIVIRKRKMTANQEGQ